MREKDNNKIFFSPINNKNKKILFFYINKLLEKHFILYQTVLKTERRLMLKKLKSKFTILALYKSFSEENQDFQLVPYNNSIPCIFCNSTSNNGEIDETTICANRIGDGRSFAVNSAQRRLFRRKQPARDIIN